MNNGAKTDISSLSKSQFDLFTDLDPSTEEIDVRTAYPVFVVTGSICATYLCTIHCDS